MKFRLRMKHADAIDDLIADCLDAVDSDEDHKDFISLREMVERFVEYGEYVTLEFDTETQNVKVLEV